MNYHIIGNTMPVVEVELDHGEGIYTQAGSMSWMTGGIQMTTRKDSTRKGIGRILAGESLFITTYQAVSDHAGIGFFAAVPGEIFPVVLETYQGLICQKDAFLCAENTVILNNVFTKYFTTGLFGDVGLILQEMTGSGIVFLEINGNRCEKTLKAGEELYVNVGNIVAFEKTVSYETEKRKEIANLIRLTGPGRVILQTQNFAALCGRMKTY